MEIPETWKIVPFATKYEASTFGNVRNKSNMKNLSPAEYHTGYMRIGLCNNDGNGKHSTTVHRVIALTFIPNPEQKCSVRHKNRDKKDNRVVNLEWATVTECNQLRRKQIKRDHYTNSARAVWKCDMNTGERLERFESLKIAALSVTDNKDGKSKICAVARKQIGKDGYMRKSAFGFKWEYEEESVIIGEGWKPIDPQYTKGVEGYHISSEGRIRNHHGRVGLPFGKPNDYCYHAIHPHQFRVHRLVALTFLEPIPGKDIVNHIDGDKTNCRSSNLEWCTFSENSQHAHDTGLNCIKKKIRQHTLDGNFIKEYESVTKAQVENGFVAIKTSGGTSYGYQWRVDGDDTPVTPYSSYRRVRQYTLTGDFVKEYNSITEATVENNWPNLFFTGHPQRYGFQWRFSDDETPVSNDVLGECKRYKGIRQYTVEGVFVKEYSSVSKIFWVKKSHVLLITPETTNMMLIIVWVKAHMNFGNMIQWVEPLIMAVMGSSDSEAVCDNNEFVEGSYRTTAAGWGVPGTTDVRTFGTNGTGRYVGSGFEWLMEVTPETSGLWGCVEEGMGSDIRTKYSGEVGPTETLPPMTVGNGFELRIFDNFPIEHFPMAYRLVGLLAEASRVHQAGEYIYGNEAWKLSAQAGAIEGWNAILDSDYVVSLEKNLDIDLSGLDGNLQAFEVFKELFSELMRKHRDGMWTSLLLEDLDFDVEDLVSPNRLSWESGAIDADFTPDKIREALGIKSDGVVTLSEVNRACMGDVEELVYLADTFGMVESIETNSDGSVKSAKFKSKDLDKEVEERFCGA